MVEIRFGKFENWKLEIGKEKGIYVIRWKMEVGGVGEELRCKV
jgi:hypothetical protein